MEIDTDDDYDWRLDVKQQCWDCEVWMRVDEELTDDLQSHETDLATDTAFECPECGHTTIAKGRIIGDEGSAE